MKREEMEKEHSELKARLAELVDFISSPEYYTLDNREKSLLTMQRSGMETYISALSIRLWCTTDIPNSSMMLSNLLASMFMPPSIPTAN